jgi:hypothetical protein
MSAAAGLGRLADYRGARRADDGENYALPAAVIAAAAAADGGGGVGSGRGSRWNEESGERGHGNGERDEGRPTQDYPLSKNEPAMLDQDMFHTKISISCQWEQVLTYGDIFCVRPWPCAIDAAGRNANR